MLPLLFTVVLVTAPPAPPDIVPVARGFVDGLNGDALHCFQGVAEGDDAIGQWQNVRDLSERFDELALRLAGIDSVEVEGETARVVLRTQGMAVTNGLRRPRALDHRWVLTLARSGAGWKIRSAMLYERDLARRIAALSDEAARRALVAQTDASLILLGRELSDEATTLGERGPALAALAVELVRPHGTAGDLAFTLRNHARTLFNGRSENEALRHAREALAVAEEDGDPDAIVIGRFSVGITLWLYNYPEEGLRSLVAAAAMIDELEDPVWALKALHMKNFIHLRRGELRETLIGSTVLTERSRRHGWSEGELAALFTVAEVRGRFGDLDASNKLAEEMYAVARSIHNPRLVFYSLVNIAAGLAAVNRREEAVVLYRRSLAEGAKVMTVEQEAMVHDSIASQLCHLGRYAEAQREAEEALRLASPQIPWTRGGALTNLARVRLASGDTEEAIRLFHEADALLSTPEEGDRSTTGNAVWPNMKVLLAEAYRATCRDAEAEKVLRDAVAMIEESRDAIPEGVAAKSSFLGLRAAAYFGLIEVQLEQGHALEALAAAELLKARTLRDMIESGAGGRLSAALLPEEKKRETELNQKIATLNRARLTAARTEQAAVEADLAAAREDLTAFLAGMYAKYETPQAKRLDVIADVGAAARAVFTGTTSVIAEFVVTEKEAFLFVLRRGDERVHVSRVGHGRKDIAAEVTRYRTALEQRDLQHGRIGASLYRKLLGPLDADIAAGATIAIVPDAELWLLPFHALRRADGRYVADLATLHYAPSIAMLSPSQRRETNRNPTVLAVANPRIDARTDTSMRAMYRDLALGDLPEATEEATAIGEMYDGAVQLTGDQAIESAVKAAAPAYDILHFATHAIADSRAPMFSAMVLGVKGGDATEDGLLEAREIANLRLRARLAILSACDTAAGAVLAGEGVVGLSWAFMAAGCPTTVASRWKAESRSTATLMVAFHKELRAGHSPAEALRRAQRALRADPRYSHPFYWAPFAVIGRP